MNEPLNCKLTVMMNDRMRKDFMKWAIENDTDASSLVRQWIQEYIKQQTKKGGKK